MDPALTARAQGLAGVGLVGPARLQAAWVEATPVDDEEYENDFQYGIPHPSPSASAAATGNAATATDPDPAIIWRLSSCS